MTRILFLPNDRTLFTLESTDPPEKLIQIVNQGTWQLPDPLTGGTSLPDPETLHAVRLGKSAILIFRPADPSFAEQTGSNQTLLNPRQLLILQHLSRGMTVMKIAGELGVSRRTVFLHMAAIRRKLRAASMPEAVRRAIELGLCQAPVSGLPTGNPPGSQKP